MEFGKVLYNRLVMEAVDRQVKELGEARIKRWEKALEAEVEALEPKSHNPLGYGGFYGEMRVSWVDINYFLSETHPAPFDPSLYLLTIPEDQA